MSKSPFNELDYCDTMNALSGSVLSLVEVVIRACDDNPDMRHEANVLAVARAKMEDLGAAFDAWEAKSYKPRSAEQRRLSEAAAAARSREPMDAKTIAHLEASIRRDKKLNKTNGGAKRR